jgi:hypothetical protein
MSRQTKRNADVVLEVVSHVSQGLPIKAAATASGISPVTLWRWRQKDEALDLAIQRARTMFIARQLSRIDAAGEKEWKAAAWLLERRHPGDFGRRVEVKIDNDPTPVLDPLTGEVIGASPEPQSGDEAHALRLEEECTPERTPSMTREDIVSPGEAERGPLRSSEGEPSDHAPQDDEGSTAKPGA